MLMQSAGPRRNAPGDGVARIRSQRVSVPIAFASEIRTNSKLCFHDMTPGNRYMQRHRAGMKWPGDKLARTPAGRTKLFHPDFRCDD